MVGDIGTFSVLGFQRIPLLNIFTRTKAIKKGLESNFVVVITFTCIIVLKLLSFKTILESKQKKKTKKLVTTLRAMLVSSF